MGKEKQKVNKYESAKQFLSALETAKKAPEDVLGLLKNVIENKTILSQEQKSTLKNYFENTDTAIAKTEGWKNLYNVYLENQITDKMVQIDTWTKEKKDLGDRMKALKNSVDVAGLDESLEIAERNEKQAGQELEKAKQKYEKKRAEHKAKGFREIGLFQSTAKIKEDVDIFDVMSQRVEHVANFIWNNREDIDQKANRLLETRKRLLEYKKAQITINGDRKKREELISKVIKQGKAIPELKEHAIKIEEHNKCEQALKKFNKEMNGISYEERGILRDDETTKKFYHAVEEVFKIIDPDMIKRLNDGKELEWKHLSIDGFEQLLQKYIDKAAENVSLSKDEVKNSKQYEEIFEGKELKEVEEKIERYNQLKEIYTDSVLEEEEAAVKEANQERNDFFESYKSAFDEIGVKIPTIREKDAIQIDEKSILKADQIIELLEKRKEKLERDIEIYESNLELREFDKEVRQLEKELKEDIRVKTANELRAQKAEFENIKQETDALKGKITPEAVNGSIKEKAELLFDQKDFRKGSHSDSKEYKAMIAALTIVKEWGNPNMADKLNSSKAPKSFNEALELLKDTSDKYLKAKASQIRLSPSALRQTRLGFAESLKSFATTSLSTCNDLLPKENSQNLKRENIQVEMEGPKEQVTLP